ncbi:hypothetical protein MES4922_160038 [Mesorhizobium ventifaucium]|uniref:Uncharacterized protein n=1 Tax=Mesorhizobium ventifaucium TaxID=666020 RepID=A0ABN8JG48_9HYPH|nr:hypothetical protein MES4922_160038 [Mesorhizobium ventifaucium]
MQVLQVQQQQAFLVGDAEGDVHDAFLRLGQVHKARQQQRPHFRDSGADRMALLAEKIPEDDRKFLEIIGIELDLLGALDQKILCRAHHGDTGQIALNVGAEDRHAGIGETFRQNLQAHGLAGAGRAGDQAVTIAILKQQIFGALVAVIRLSAGSDENTGVVNHVFGLRKPEVLNAPDLLKVTGLAAGIMTPLRSDNGHGRNWAFWSLRILRMFGNRLAVPRSRTRVAL